MGGEAEQQQLAARAPSPSPPPHRTDEAEQQTSCAPSPSPPPPPARRVRVLALHGMGTNAAVFAHQLAPLLAAFAGGLELIHVQGAHPSPPATKLVGALFPGPFYRYAAREGRRYVGLGDAVAQVTAALERERPEGLVGFSQGANVATMAVARAAARGSPLPSWALLFAGPQFGWAHDGGFGATPGDFASPLPVRSAHVVGDAEPQRDDCLALAKLWRAEGRAELRHSGDHRPFPAQPAEAQALAAAIKRWVLTGRAEEEGAGGGA